MPTFDSGRAGSIGGWNIRQRRGSDLGAIRFDADITTTPTSTNDMLLYRRSSGLRFWDGTTEYNLLTSVSGSVGDLNGVYENGSTITVDEGAIVLNDGQATANTLTATKTGTGSGHIFSLKFEDAANTAARAIYIDMDDGIAAEGIEIDSGGTARTGSDLIFTDDSTGAHSIIDINSSGSGASIGLDFTGTFSGSPGGSAISITLGNGNNLNTTGFLFTGGTGVRTAPVIDIDDAGTGSAAMIDIDLSGAYTGDIFQFATSGIATGNVFFVNLDTAVAMTALHIEGSGARTQPMIELQSDSTGTLSMVEVILTGAISGHVLEVSMDTTSTGDVFNVDMNAAVGGRFLFLDAGAGARTANLIAVTYDSTGNLDLCEIADNNTGSGQLFDINVGGAGSGNVIDITYGAVADTGDAIAIDLGATATGAQAIVLTSGVMTRTTNLVEIAENGAASGNTIDVGIGAVTYTGNVLDINLGATATGGQAVVIASGAMNRTVALLEIGDAGTSSGILLDINITGAVTGNIVDIVTSAAATGNVINIDLDAGLAATAVRVDSGAGLRTQPVVEFIMEGTGTGAGGTLIDIDVNESGATSNPLIDIDFATGVYAGNVFEVGLASACTGNVIHIDMNAGVAATAIHLDAGAVTRTQPLMETTFDGAGTTIGGTLWDINVTNTGAAASPLFDIDVTAVYTGNIIDIVFGNASASTGDALHIDMGTNLAGNAIQIDAAGTRSEPLINIVNTGADGGTNDHVILISQTGVLNSDVINITYSSGASDGNALFIGMGTNVAGSAIQMTTAGTGVSGEGCALDITHTGALVAGADLVNITSNGNHSSTSNLFSIEATGASTAGRWALYINSTDSGMEGLKVDAGAVVFDETLLVTGVATFTAKPVLPILTELNTTIDTRSTAAAINATATATAAEVATGRITSTSAAATTITLPTGTLLGGELSASAGDVFDLVIDNSAGASTVTIAVAVNGVLSTAAVDTGGSFGDLTVASGVTGVAVYRIMFTSATAYAFTRVA